MRERPSPPSKSTDPSWSPWRRSDGGSAGVRANILWDDPASEPIVRGFVLDVANPQEKRAREIADALQVAWKNLQGLEEERERTMAAVEFLSKLRTAKAELQGFRDRMQKRNAETGPIDLILAETDRYEAQV